MFSFSHPCKVLQGKRISIFWDSGIVEKLHWLLGRGYLLGCSVIFAPETFFVISAVLAQEESVVLPLVR
jgi:hypothetical protein